MSHHSTGVTSMGRNRRSGGLLASGAASVNIYQRMMISRKRVVTGSIESDWKSVGADVKSALMKVKNQLESA